MTFVDQTPFDSARFADNPEPRCPCILLLDTSGSMSGEPIRQLNEGIQAFREELLQDELAARRVEVAVVTFGPVQTVSPFTTPDLFFPPQLMTSGDTPMGAAVVHALKMIEDQKALYRANGIAYFRPWIFLITDGAPTDAYKTAAAVAREGESAKKFNFFAVGVRGADFEKLKEFSGQRPPVALDGLKFREMFRWLSSSLKAVSHSQSHTGANPDERLALPPPDGWTSI
jgi:uncharacterized protein YegL